MSNKLSLACLFLACAAGGQGMKPESTEVGAGVSVPLVDGWKQISTPLQGLVALQREAGPDLAYMILVSTEDRSAKHDAVRRLGEIAEGAPPSAFFELCGWPAAELRARVKRPVPEAAGSSKFAAADAWDEKVTVAVAVSDAIVQFNGTVPAGTDEVGRVVKLVRSASCPKNPDPSSTRKALLSLRAGFR